MMTVREASLYCVYNPGWNGDDRERGVTVLCVQGGMVMTVSEASLYCVYNPRWNGDDCEGGVTVLCVQPWVEW